MRFLVPGEPCGRSPRTRPPLTNKPPVEAATGWEPLAADQFRTAALCPPPNPPRSSLFKSPVGAVQVAADSPGKPSRQAISVRRAGCSLREQTRAAVLARSFPLQANRTAGPPRTKVSHSPRGPWGQIWRLTPHVGLLCQASIPPNLVRRAVQVPCTVCRASRSHVAQGSGLPLPSRRQARRPQILTSRYVAPTK